MVDGVTEGEVCSETEYKGLFHRHDDGFASFRSPGTHRTDLFGVSRGISESLHGLKRVRMARPPHNAG